AAIFLRRQALALQQGVGVLVPLAVGEIVPEHGGGGLRLVGDSETEVSLDQAVERFGRMARGLVILKDVAKAIDGGGVIAAVEIEPPDRHFLARQLIFGDRDLEFRVFGVFRLRVFIDDRFERLQRLLRLFLVARDIRYLHVIGIGLQVQDVIRLRRVRVVLEVALGGRFGAGVVARLIIGIGGHQLALARPVRVWILLAEVGEFLRGVRRRAIGQFRETLVVGLARRNVRRDLHLVFFSA